MNVCVCVCLRSRERTCFFLFCFLLVCFVLFDHCFTVVGGGVCFSLSFVFVVGGVFLFLFVWGFFFRHGLC